MSPKECFGFALVAAVSGTSGWLLGGKWGEARIPETRPAVRPEARHLAGSDVAPGAPAKPIEVHSDGRVSLHLGHAPLEWVLEELERRQPRRLSRMPTAAPVTSIPDPVTCKAADPGELSPQQQAALLRNLHQGSDAERQAALVRAGDAGVVLPPQLLRQLFESDPSEAVRLLAFTAYLDAVADDLVTLRAALESGTYNQSEAVQQVARRYANERAAAEDAVASTPARGAP